MAPVENVSDHLAIIFGINHVTHLFPMLISVHTIMVNEQSFIVLLFFRLSSIPNPHETGKL
jgi:hypothetical protein